MELLSKLTPAETLLLVRAIDHPREKLLRITFFELLLRGAFEVKDKSSQGHFIDATGSGFFVFPGKNFEQYNYQPHEQIFVPGVSDFAGMSLRELIVHVWRVLEYSFSLHSMIRSSAYLAPLRRRSLEDYLRASRYSYEGRQLKKLIEKRLRELGREVPAYLQQDPVKAFEILSQVGGNILLVEGFDVDLFGNLTEAVAQTYYEQNPDFDPHYFNWKYWHVYPGYVHYFSENYNLMKEEREEDRTQDLLRIFFR